MTKKGKKGTYHKPKPRVGVLGGIAVGLLRAGSNAGHKGVDIVTGTGGNRVNTAGAVVAGIVDKPGEAAVNAGVPALVGVAASIAADKLGVNKALAKAKVPIRI